MKKCVVFIFALVLMISSHAQLPDFELKDLNQNWTSLNDLKGEELTLIDFWATWCKPCVLAIPKLNSIYTDFSEKGLEIIGVNVDGPRNQAKVKPFSTSLNIQYPVVLDPDKELTDELNVNVFPTLIVFNNKGKKVFIHEGFNPGDEELIREELNKLLNQ